MYKVNFFFSDTASFGNKQAEVSRFLCEMLEGKKDFSVEFKYDKTPKQHRGYWRLCSLLAPVFQEKWKEAFDKDIIDDVIKRACGYFIEIRGEKYTKSLKNADREQLDIFIEKLYEICEFFGLKDYELLPAELRDMNEYFNLT